MRTISKTYFAKATYSFFFLASIVLLCSATMRSNSSDELELGTSMPLSSHELESSDGTMHSLESLKGSKGLVVVFSCNTCPFVVGSDSFEGWENQYNAIHAKAKELNLEMVLVNSNAAKRADVDSKEAMASHKAELGYTMPYLIDMDAKLADAFGAKTTPHVYVFDANNALVYKGSIDNSWDTKKESLETYLYDAMDALANENAIVNNSTTPRGCSIKRSK